MLAAEFQLQPSVINALAKDNCMQIFSWIIMNQSSVLIAFTLMVVGLQ